MRRTLLPLLSAGLLLAPAAGARAADDDPKAIIAKAIKAEGGEEALTKYKATQTKQQVTEALAKLGKVSSNQVTFTDVGPSWGHEITKKAERALIVFFVLIIGYISIRFEWKMAAAAVILTTSPGIKGAMASDHVAETLW